VFDPYKNTYPTVIVFKGCSLYCCFETLESNSNR